MKRNAGSLKGQFCFVFALSFVLCSTLAFGATIQVPGDHKTIQAAIDASVNGDTVLVADGTYKGQGNKDLDFNGKELIVQSANGPLKTIIDCENDGRGFYFHSGELEDARVSGFTVTNGRVLDQGGAIYVINSAPTITNCIIVNNTATTSSKTSQGGGIYLGNAGSATIANCVISKNTSNYEGGGIYIYNSSASITNCTITRNIAINGGGLYVRHKPAPVFSNCIFWGNTPNEVVKDLKDTPAPKISFSIVQGGYDGGNLNRNPMFMGSGDFYHLSDKSPAIDRGTGKEAPEIDIDGDKRPQGKRVDIGADEYVSR